MDYQQREEGDANPDAYEGPDNVLIPKGEQARVAHLVHGWIQRCRSDLVIRSFILRLPSSSHQ